MEKKRFFSAKEITGIAVLLALVIVLQAVGGSISIGVVTLNFTLIPIVLGAILYGPLVGGLLGFACGVVVLVQVIFGTGFYAVIWANSPVVTILTCIVKTTVAGIVSGYVYKLLKKKNDYVALFVASGLVPVVNTALFIVGCLCMNQAILIFQSDLGALEGYTHVLGMNPLVFILVILVTFNFFFEFAINLIVAPALHRAIGVLQKVYKRK